LLELPSEKLKLPLLELVSAWLPSLSISTLLCMLLPALLKASIASVVVELLLPGVATPPTLLLARP